MTTFKDLTAPDKQLLCSVPYRVGVWISDIDDNIRTRRDDRVEQKSLEVFIEKLATNDKKFPFAAIIMQGVRSQKSSWNVWQGQSTEQQVLKDLSAALAICQANFTKRQVNEYKQAVWQSALVVAQAFGEQVDPDNEMHVNNFFSLIGGLVGRPALKKRPENISAKEKTALKKLRAVLKS